MAKNGTKLNGTLKTVIAITVIAVGIGGAWATKNFDVATNTANIKTNSDDIKVNAAEIEKIDEETHGIKEDVREIFVEQRAFRNSFEKAVDRIEKKLDK